MGSALEWCSESWVPQTEPHKLSGLLSDLQVTDFSLAKHMSMLAASGPTWDQLPPFQWSRSPFHNVLHMGQPDLWTFSPIQVPWD